MKFSPITCFHCLSCLRAMILSHRPFCMHPRKILVCWPDVFEHVYFNFLHVLIALLSLMSDSWRGARGSPGTLCCSSPEECVKQSPRPHPHQSASISVYMVFNWPNVYCLELSICLKSAKVILVAWFQSVVLVSGWWRAIAYCLQIRQSGSLSLCLPF